MRQITANPRINGKSVIENPHIQHTQQHVSYRISRVSSGRCGGAAVDFNAARSMAAYIWQGKGSTRDWGVACSYMYTWTRLCTAVVHAAKLQIFVRQALDPL